VITADRGNAPEVRIEENAFHRGEAIALDAAPHEIGGILVGWWEGGGIAVVRGLLPVPDHRAGRAHYERRHAPAQQVLDEYLATSSEPNVGYIGEWHSHPTPQPPSPTDRHALTGLVRQARHPVALVVLAVMSEDAVEAYSLIGQPCLPGRATIEPADVERIAP
jgi:integrative and conjugative element protein (TIGR02256 family)